MDPLPFLVMAVLIFWLTQTLTWLVRYINKPPQPKLVGIGEVSDKDYITTKVQKFKKKKNIKNEKAKK